MTMTKRDLISDLEGHILEIEYQMGEEDLTLLRRELLLALKLVEEAIEEDVMP
jgi:hypothetical protein